MREEGNFANYVVMFITVILLAFTIPISIIPFTNNVSAVPSGPTDEDSFKMTLDKAEYKPGETVIIRIDNDFYNNPSATVTIKKARTYDDSITSTNYRDLEIVYNEVKTLVNGTIMFEYELPPAAANSGLFWQNTQRYIVLLDDPSVVRDINGEAYLTKPTKTSFFTVSDGDSMSFPLIFGIGAAIAGAVAFLTLRKHKH